VPIEDGELDAGNVRPSTADGSGPGPQRDQSGAERATRDGRGNARIATPETAAVRSAVTGPPSRMAVGTPVGRVVEDDHGVDRGEPQRAIAAITGKPIEPTRSSPPRVGASQMGRHRMGERSVRRG